MKRNTKTTILAVVAVGGVGALFATGVLDWEAIKIRLNWASGTIRNEARSSGGNPNVNVHNPILAAQCRANLKMIESAKRRIAGNRSLVGGAMVSANEVDAELARMGARLPLVCPAGGNYKLNPIGMNCKCSIGANNTSSKEDDHINLD